MRRAESGFARAGAVARVVWLVAMLAVTFGSEAAPPPRASSPEAAAASRPPEHERRLVMLPLGASTPGVSSQARARASELLLAELRAGARFEVLDPPSSEADASSPALAALRDARALATQAVELRSRRQLDEAAARSEASLSAFLRGASELAEVSELQDVLALLAACHAQRGRDAAAARALTEALAVAPSRVPPLAQTSPLFASAVDEARAALRRAPSGGAVFDSSPAGASVVVDGLPVGESPVRVRSLPPGRHLWRATLWTGERVGGVLEVAAGREFTVTVASAKSDPASQVLTSLSLGSVDAATLAAALAIARSRDAALVVFGALGLEDGALVLESFIASVEASAVRRLPARRFDPELLSAVLELHTLARELLERRGAAGTAMRLPEPVRALAAASPPRTLEVDFAALAAAGGGLGATAAPQGAADDIPDAGTRGGPSRRAPLRAR